MNGTFLENYRISKRQTELKVSKPKSVHWVRYNHGVRLSARRSEAYKKHANGK